MQKPVSLFKFIDGPLMAQEQRRADVVQRMAKDLIEQDAFRCESDAIRLLMHRGYPSYDVMALVGYAQQEAEEQLNAADITILDHHKTAQADLEEFAILNPVTAETIDVVLAATQPFLSNIRAEFDMNRSGAMMAWQFIFPEALIPDFVKLIEDRDLWRFKYGERTKQFSAALRTYPMDFWTWDGLIVRVPELVIAGATVLRAHNANIEKFLADRYLDTIDGVTVPVVNVPYHYASDTAHALLQKCPEAPFAACWFRRGDGLIQFSLRSEDHRVDVSEVAKKFGGGGHRNAAGFQVAPDVDLSAGRFI